MKININCEEVKLYDVQCLCKLFFNNDFLGQKETQDYVEIKRLISSVIVEINVNNHIMKKTIDISDNDLNLAVNTSLYQLLCDITQYSPPWGLLTGIRPVKLYRNFVKNMGEESTKKYFKQKFLVSDPKINLVSTVINAENKILSLSKLKSVSLYISIPFCPTKCSYCSFVSSSVQNTVHLVNTYLELLCKELDYTAKIIRDLDLTIETIYIGGGTPTTLNPNQLKQLIDTVNEKFNVKNIKEFTVEAGRPDTITKDKLMQLGLGNITRISINPQTLDDNILNLIGRNHNTKQTIKSFYLAREMNFKNINMDIIAGLPGDTLEGFKKTLLGILNLSPESVTVHTLCIKRASSFSKDKRNDLLSDTTDVSKMLDFAQSVLSHQNFIPYYLYRQSDMVGNFENIGWSKPDMECFYNVYIMSEVHTIISCGAGAVTKLINPYNNLIERVFNFKYPHEYIGRFDELLKRKERIKSFYDKL